MKKPVVLCIMDGYGKNDSDYGNAIAMAKKPNLDRLMAQYPMTYIGASGLDVGLPNGQMGNSEVGHTNIGAGRVVYQPLTRITKAFEDGEAEKNPALTHHCTTDFERRSSGMSELCEAQETHGSKFIYEFGRNSTVYCFVASGLLYSTIRKSPQAI